MKTVSAREANQSFSKLLAAVEAGEEIAITKRGRRIAEILPPRSAREGASKAKEAAIRRMLAKVRKGVDLGGLTFTRDEAYER